MSINLSSWEGEIGRIMVPGQTGRRVELVRPYLIGKKIGILLYTCHPINSRKYKIGGLQSRPA
jgi:hypothetical protein